MPMDPAWNYRFPRRKEFPEDYWRCAREDMKRILDPGSRSHRSVKVITIPRTDGKGERAVALAVWELPFLGHSEISSNSIAPSFHPTPPFVFWMFPDECNTRRDADLAHIAAFRSVLIASVNKYFDAPFGNSQVQLYHLATHPDYQRHGAGTRLLNWGLELAMRERSPSHCLEVQWAQNSTQNSVSGCWIMSQSKWMGKRRRYLSVLWYTTSTYYKLLYCHLVKLEEHIRIEVSSTGSSFLRSLIHCSMMSLTVEWILVSNSFNFLS